MQCIHRGTSTSGLGDDGNRSGRAVLGKQTALDMVKLWVPVDEQCAGTGGTQ
jgi:hypothetical protein